MAVLGHTDHEAFLATGDPAIQALADRVELHEDTALATHLPSVRPARMTLKLGAWRGLVKLIEDPKGHHDNPFSDEELETKSAKLAGRYVTEAGVAEVQAFLRASDAADPVGAITD